MDTGSKGQQNGSGIKPIYIVAIAVVIAATAGAAYYVSANGVHTASNPSMNSTSQEALSNTTTPTGSVVKNGDNISVYYTGRLTNGTVFNTNVGSSPLNFTVGSGEVIKGFDNAVLGMSLFQSKVVTIPANEAYGPVNPSLIVSVPLSNFGNESSSVAVGLLVHASNGEQGIVTAVNSTNATLDFNNPLAGRTLIFNITVVAIRN